MSSLILTRREIRTQQPLVNSGIDWSNPLTNGLVSLMWCGSGHPVDLLNRSDKLTVVNASVAATSSGLGRQVASAGNNGIYGGRGGGSTNRFANARLQARPISIMFVGEIGAGDGGIAGYLSGTNTAGYGISSIYGNRTRLVRDGGAAIVSGIWSTGQGVYGFVSNGATLTCYDKGVNCGSVVSTVGAVDYNGYEEYRMFGGAYSSAPTGSGLFQAVWNRGLMADEAQEFAANPWQIFAPRETRLFVPVGGGGSVNASASGALSAVSAAAPSASASGSASATGACAAITLSTPTATASAGGSASASGSFAALSISPATATATATKSATASGAFAVVSISAPTATASGTTAGGAVATGAPAQITISHAAAIAIGSAVASGGYQSIGITAPTGSASVGSGNATASGAWAAISITAPTAYASSGFIRAPAGGGPTVIQTGSIRPRQSATSRPSNTGGRRY